MIHSGPRASRGGGFAFRIEIDGVGVAMCRSVEGAGLRPGGAIPVRGTGTRFGGSYYVSSSTHTVPAPSGVVRLRGVLAVSPRAAAALAQWCRGGAGRKTVSIVPGGAGQGPITLRRSWVRKFTGPALNGAGTDVEIDEIELAHDPERRPDDRD